MIFQEHLPASVDPTTFKMVEETIVSAVQWLRLAAEATGALIIFIGVVLAIYRFLIHFTDEKADNFNSVRLTLGTYLALALEFQVGADILSTAVAPSWEQIGKLAAIVTIRTLLNFFLTRELENERNQVFKKSKADAGGSEN